MTTLSTDFGGAANVELTPGPSVFAGALQTPMGLAVVLEATSLGRSAAAMMREMQFDQAPVMLGERLVGYALRKDLEANGDRAVSGCAEPLDQTVLLSAEAPMAALLAALRDRGMVFIVGDEGVSGFVTPSDLNRHAARAHFYLIVAALETAIAEALRASRLSKRQLLGGLAPKARRTLEKRYREDAAAGVEVDYLAYMTFSQLLNLVGRTRSLRAVLGLSSNGAWRQATTGLLGLRNAVMHPTQEFHGLIRSVSYLIDAEVRMQRLVASLREMRGHSIPKTPQRLHQPTDGMDPVRGEGRMTLHDAMASVLKDAGGPLLPAEIAKVINVRDLYRRRDGSPVPVGQIHARAHNYDHLFARNGRQIELRGK